MKTCEYIKSGEATFPFQIGLEKQMLYRHFFSTFFIMKNLELEAVIVQ
jgi:hypothetical protein